MRRVWTGGPVVDREAGREGHRLWWLGWNEGVTLARDADGTWHELRFPVDGDLAGYSLVLRGGYEQVVDEAFYDELVAAGYGSHCRTDDEYTDTFLQRVED